MDTAPVDALITGYGAIISALEKASETSLAMAARSVFTKYLIMSCGSLFEQEISSGLERVASATAPTVIAQLARNKAIKRQYHTFFDWDKSNVNSFLGLMGSQTS